MLFKDLKFVLLYLGSFIATFPLLVPPFFIPLYASSIDISGNLGSVLLALFNITSTLSRVGLGRFCDVVGPLSSLSVAIVLSAIRMLVIWPESNSLAPIVLFILINGFGNGGFFATMPNVVAHVDDTNVRVAFAMVVTSWSVGYIMVRVCANGSDRSNCLTICSHGAPVAGWILESHGGSIGDISCAAYRPVMYYAGSMSLGGALLVLGSRHIFSGGLFTFA